MVSSASGSRLEPQPSVSWQSGTCPAPSSIATSELEHSIANLYIAADNKPREVTLTITLTLTL